MKQKTFTFTVALLAPVLAGCKKHLTTLIIAFVIAVVIGGLESLLQSLLQLLQERLEVL
jgi:hypothetical protein